MLRIKINSTKDYRDHMELWRDEKGMVQLRIVIEQEQTSIGGPSPAAVTTFQCDPDELKKAAEFLI